MIDAWFTTTELASLGLPSLPATRQGWDQWVVKNDIDACFPDKVRRRAGRGGGVERHVSVLPRAAQRLLMIRHLKATEPQALQVVTAFSETATAVDGAVSEGAVLKRDAILTVLTFWDAFRGAFRGSGENARHAFCALYQADKIEGLPAWARLALLPRSGSDKRSTSHASGATGMSINTLRRWEQLRDRCDMTGLAGRHGNRKGTGVLDVACDGAVARTLAALIVQNAHFSADHLRDVVLGTFGDTLDVKGVGVPVPDLRTFQRWRNRWVETHQEVLSRMTDPDGWNNKYRIRGTNMNG